MARKASKAVQDAMAALAEESLPALREVRDRVLTPTSFKAHVPCPRCKEMKTLDVDVPGYNLKDINAFFRLLADFGVGKPAQEIEQTLRLEKRWDSLSDEELEAIERGEAVFEGVLPELPPAA